MITVVTVITIAETNIQTMKVVAMIDGTTTAGQGRSKEEVTMDINRRVDVVGRLIRHHGGISIATDILARVQGLVHRQCRNDLTR